MAYLLELQTTASTMSLKTKARVYLQELKAKWHQLQETPGVFVYCLNVVEHKYLSGQQQFYVELNPQRTTLRRPPQAIASLNPKFQEDKFTFKKIKPLELIMNIPYEGLEISMIVNNSPLTSYHTLICPALSAGYPQRLTVTSLSFSVTFLQHVEETAFRIGYNSPGALASVNHLHLHLMHIDLDLYIDKAKLELLSGTHVYRLRADMPTEAICFLIFEKDNEAEIKIKVKQVHDFIMWLCDRNLPHNLFITPNRIGAVDVLKIFVFARQNYCLAKDTSTYNIGFCELAGYIPVGDERLFESITEEKLIARIREETGEAYEEIYNYFTK